MNNATDSVLRQSNPSGNRRRPASHLDNDEQDATGGAGDVDVDMDAVSNFIRNLDFYTAYYKRTRLEEQIEIPREVTTMGPRRVFKHEPGTTRPSQQIRRDPKPRVYSDPEPQTCFHPRPQQLHLERQEQERHSARVEQENNLERKSQHCKEGRPSVTAPASFARLVENQDSTDYWSKDLWHCPENPWKKGKCAPYVDAKFKKSDFKPGHIVNVPLHLTNHDWNADSKYVLTNSESTIFSKRRPMIILWVAENHFFALCMFTHGGKGIGAFTEEKQASYINVKRQGDLMFTQHGQHPPLEMAKCSMNAKAESAVNLYAGVKVDIKEDVEFKGNLTADSHRRLLAQWSILAEKAARDAEDRMRGIEEMDKQIKERRQVIKAKEGLIRADRPRVFEARQYSKENGRDWRFDYDRVVGGAADEKFQLGDLY